MDESDAYKQYKNVYDYDLDDALSKEEFVTKIKEDYFSVLWGDLGPIYGKQWKDWDGVDQIKNLIESLKENPHGRRHLVAAWNVSELPNMTFLPVIMDSNVMWTQTISYLLNGIREC